MTIDLEKIREAYVSDQVQTHSAECYLWHPLCAIRVLADEVERLRAEIEDRRSLAQDRIRE